MNKWNQSIQAFITSFGPFCDRYRASLFTYHRISDSSNTCQEKAFQNNLRAYVWQFSHGFHFLFFEVVVIDAWSRYFVELLRRLIGQLTISLHTFLCMTIHIIRPWRNTKILKKYENSLSMEVFQLLQRKFWIRTWFCNCQQYLCLFHIVFECSPSIHDRGKMLVLPNQLLCWALSTSDQGFVSFHPIWCHPHTQIRIILYHGARISIPNWKTFSQPYFNRIFSNCLSHNSPARGWPYRFRSRGTSILDHDLGHYCRGGRIQMSGHSDLGIFVIWVHPPFFLGISRYCVSCLSCAPWQSGCDIHDFCCCHLWCGWSFFCEYCIRTRIVFYNITSEYNSTFVCLVLRLQFGISSNDRCPSVGRNELLRPSSLFHKSPVSYFWLLSGSTPKFLQVLPFFIHCCFCCGYLHWLRHRNKFYVPNSNTVVNCPPFLQYGPHDDSVEILPYAVLWIHWLPGYTQVLS